MKTKATCMVCGYLRTAIYGRGWSCDRGFDLRLRAHGPGGDPLTATSRVGYEPCPTCPRDGETPADTPASAPRSPHGKRSHSNTGARHER